MRAAPLLVAGVLLLVTVPTVAAEPEPFRFTDPEDDVRRGNVPMTGAVAEATDVVSAAMGEHGEELVFELTLKDLSGAEDASKEPGFNSIQYALAFTSHPHHSGYEMRAVYRFPAGNLVPLLPPPPAQWEFSIHDTQGDDWPPVPGRIVNSTIEWTIAREDILIGPDGIFSGWSASVWASYESGEQVSDNAAGDGKYQLGVGPLTVEHAKRAGGSVAAGAMEFSDNAGDVEMGGKPYRGPGAETTDILNASVAEYGSSLVFSLRLANLSGLAVETSDPNFHAQYAFSFALYNGWDYSMRATYRDQDWRFSLHNQTADDWPDATGEVQGDTILWTASRSDFGIGNGSVLDDWTISTWNSYEYREQYGDRAQGYEAFELGADEGAGPADPATEAPEATASHETATEEAVAVPGIPLTVLFATAAALTLWRRRS